MSAWLGGWGYHADPDRGTAMKWMGHAMPMAEMPGMATAGQMAELRAAEGRQVDALFLSMMSEHHRGGVEMAAVAQKTAGDGTVRDLAAAIVRNQGVEINEMEQ